MKPCHRTEILDAIERHLRDNGITVERIYQHRHVSIRWRHHGTRGITVLPTLERAKLSRVLNFLTRHIPAAHPRG